MAGGRSGQKLNADSFSLVRVLGLGLVFVPVLAFEGGRADGEEPETGGKREGGRERLPYYIPGKPPRPFMASI